MKSHSIEYFLTNNINFSKSKREIAINRIEKEKYSVKNLVCLLKNTEAKKTSYLICLCDTLSRIHTSYLLIEKEYFIEIASKETNESNKRCLTNIFITMLTFHYNTFSSKQKEQIMEVCFNWLIDDSLIATQCNCLTCLDILSKDIEWIKDELLLIIDKTFTQKPVSYQSRAKKILKKYRTI